MNTKISNEIVSIYRGWYKFSKNTSDIISSKLILIDDLAEKNIKSKEYKNTEDVIKDFNLILKKLTVNDEYINAKIHNSISYLQYNIKKRMSNSNLKDFIQSLGTKWRKPKLSELDEIKKLITSFKSSIVKQENVKNELNNYVDYIKNELKKHHGVLCDFELKYIELDNELPWRNIITHEEDCFKVLININKNNVFTEHDIISFAFHEVFGHVLHFNSIKKSTKLNQHQKCISVHTLDSFYVESMAQLLYAFFVKNYFYSDSKILDALYKFQLFFAVRQYNVINIIENTMSIDEAVKLHLKYLDDDVLLTQKLYKNITASPFFCSQIMNYHEGLHILNPILKLPKVKTFKIIEKLLSEPFRHEDINHYV